MEINVENFNNQSRGEELANSIFHGIGAILSIAGTIVLIVFACLKSDTIGIVSSSIYGFSLILLFTMSTLYHSFTNARVKRVFQVMDHCSVFMLILGSYTPICLALLRNELGIAIWSVNIFFTAIGITANAINIRRWHKLSLVLYLLMGWSIIFAIRMVIDMVPFEGFMLLLAGGLCYSVGVIFYIATKPRYMHAIWHFFVLCGAILHYFFILWYIIF